jgi:RHH-type proline utilization regulon transcriptional repressor/proline dehydrogenase/delta 1-pyrroline-5-carboxylate dehydrogenase
VRLVKGAYWDYETVLADQMGWPSPVYREKWRTDANFEACLRLLMENHQVVRVALGSHNVRSIAVALALAESLSVPREVYEFQMLFGMGEPIKKALSAMGHPVRIYAPIGDMLEGMAYLVRRLLENTSNESFLRHHFAEGEEAELLLRPPGESAAQTGQQVSPRDPAPGRATFANAPLLDFSRPENRQAMQEAISALRGGFPLKAAAKIGGRRVSGTRSVAVHNPADPDEVVGELGLADADQAESAVEIARDAGAGWAAVPAGARAATLREAAKLMLERRFSLNALMVIEVGKSWEEADADFAEAVDFLNYYACEMERLAPARLTQAIPGEENHYHYQPKGVAVVIAPWNFPLAISTGMTSAALVTGNTVIYKPANASSLTGQAMVDILHQAGIPPAVLTYLPGLGGEVGKRLVAHPEVNLIAFTGSREVGLNIVEVAGRTLPGQRAVKKVIAEMGGKNAIIVDDDADLDEAIRGILHSAFSYQGQKCSACSRLIVLEGVLERVVERLAKAVRDLRLGPPEDPAFDVGPLISSAAQENVNRYALLGEKEGRVEARAEGVPAKGWYAPPVILSGIAPESALAQEEIFGPIVVVLPAKTFDHALELANSTEFCLTGGVYSRSPEHLEQARRRFRVGNLYLNRGITGAIVGRQPFGGFGMSGIGSKAGGPDYLLQFMEPRTITENTLRQGFIPASPEDSGERRTAAGAD